VHAVSVKTRARTATHRPPLRRRRFRHDELTFVDLFSGFGGLTRGAVDAGFTAIMAANHNPYKVEVHEANHPEAEHWIADLVDEDSGDYHSAADLPPGDMLGAGISCVNHTQANTQKAYEQGASLFDLDDPDYEARVTRSERDRATAICVLQYAGKHRPSLILLECTTEIQSWGPAVPGKTKVGDGSTYRWWLKEISKLGYNFKVVFLNSMFFDVGQSRDRWYFAAWLKHLPTPDLEHRPLTWCAHCDEVLPAMQTWRTGIPPTGSVRYGKQYDYRCPRCRAEVVPSFTPSITALDLTDLGTRIGDRKRPLAAATMARAEKCRQKFTDFPAVLMPAKALRGTERHPWQPMATQTSQQETAVLSTGGIMVGAGNGYEHPGSSCRSRSFDEPLWSQTSTATTGILAAPAAIAVGNFQGAPRGLDDALPTPGGSETLAVISSGVLPYRKNTTPTSHAEPMPTVTSAQTPALLTAAGRVQCNGSIEEAKYRTYPLDRPLGTVVGTARTQGLLFSGWTKMNGSTGTETRPHPVLDPFNTLTSRDTTALVSAEWQQSLSELALEDCYFRMMFAREIGRGCGFDVDFGSHKGTFVVWGSNRDQVDGYGNAVSPPVGQWISGRLRAVLHGQERAG